MSKNAFFHLKSADFETVCNWSTSSWRNNLGIPWCNNIVPNNLDDVITLFKNKEIYHFLKAHNFPEFLGYVI